MSPQESEREFDRFYEAVHRPLIGQAYLLTGDLQWAEDLVQETLVRAWQRWDRVGHLEDPHGWARRVLHNLAVSHMRRRAVRLRYAASEVRVSPEPSSSDVDLMSGLRKLPVNQRRALVLTAVAGLQVAEVAKEMNVREGTVRVWLSRGRAELAGVLDLTRTPRREPDAT